MTETDQNAVSGVWIGTSRYTYTLDASGADTLIQADTFNTASSFWKPYYAGRYTNNASGKPLTVYYYFWSNATSSYSGLIQRTTYSYDGTGNNTGYTVELYTTSTGIWRNSYRYVYTYNTGRKQTFYSYQTWNTTTSTWGGTVYNYYYNASNQQTAYSYQSSLTAAGSDSANYTLDAAGNVLIENDFTKSGSAWTPSYRTTATYSTTNKEQTYVEEKYNAGSFQNYDRGFYFYNSVDQITRFYSQSWSGTAWVINTNAYEDRYYYENYNTVGIATEPKLSGNDILLYPVPATTTINLAISFGGQQSFTAVVIDAAGRVVMHWSDTTGGGIYTHSIATGGLTSGLYHLSIRSKNGIATHAFSVQH